jgi:hypothetical protein
LQRDKALSRSVPAISSDEDPKIKGALKQSTTRANKGVSFGNGDVKSEQAAEDAPQELEIEKQESIKLKPKKKKKKAEPPMDPEEIKFR